MDFAMSLTRRATCKRAQFSCVVTSEDMTQIYGFGYNGTARGFSHDDCKFDQPGNCQCVHAEQNALIKVRVNDPRKVVFVTGQPSKIARAPVVVSRNPNQTRNPTTSPPATPPGRPTFAERPYSKRIARTNAAMRLPMSPAATPFGARLRIASMSASVLPSAAIYALPNTGRAYQIPPMTKLTMVATIAAM